MLVGGTLPWRAGPCLKSVRIDPAAFPFVAIAAVPSAGAFIWGASLWAVVLLLLPVTVALFFRDPDRVVPVDPSLVVAPADGRVTHAGPARTAEAPDGSWQQVTIFLSLFDVHINRVPLGGEVRSVAYVPGSFLAAFKREAYKNEHSEVWIATAETTIVVRQVVGVLARRIVCRLVPRQHVETGERMGLMKFGSRMDVFLPLSSHLAVQAGGRVKAGETILARLASQEEEEA